MKYSWLLLLPFLFSHCNKDEETPPAEILQLSVVRVGDNVLDLTDPTKNTNAPFDKPVVATFSAILDVPSVVSSVSLQSKSNGAIVPLTFSFLDNNKSFSGMPSNALLTNTEYELVISDDLAGKHDETFAGVIIPFKTKPDVLNVSSIHVDGQEILSSPRATGFSRESIISITFSKPILSTLVNSNNFRIFDPLPISATFELSIDNKTVTITSSQPLRHLSRHQIWISSSLRGADEETFSTFSKYFYTTLDTTPKFPIISDNDLLTLVQQQTFKFFYDYAEPNSGMARERNGSNELVTTGGSGFGLMAMIVGIERNFITRQQGIDRLKKIVTFLEKADRFHGVWPHWINGNTGKVIPFSTKDNGGDLVETSFLVQGLLTFRQYLQPSDTVGNNLIKRINVLWEGVEWDWYRKNNENVLYWHWSSNYNWDMNFALYGYFEQQITYFLAAASPTHSIPKIVYTNGFGKNGSIVKNNQYEGITLPLESPSPLFFVQYSYLGLDPHFSDDYTNYWTQNVNATFINQKYCIRNPKNFVGYSDDCWGLTASDNQSGYNAHSPSNDLGVITPTAALSSFPYTPVESMKALKFFYYTLGDRLWGQYGFYDAFNVTEGWTASSYLAIDQGPIIVMIENHRTGLLWDLFMSSPEVQPAMDKLNFVK